MNAISKYAIKSMFLSMEEKTPKGNGIHKGLKHKSIQSVATMKIAILSMHCKRAII